MTDDKKSKPFKIQIDKNQYELDNPTPTARELLTIAGKTPPEHFALYLKDKGKPQRLQLDERVDLREPGVEKFVTLPLDQTEGLGAGRRQFSMPQRVVATEGQQGGAVLEYVRCGRFGQFEQRFDRAHPGDRRDVPVVDDSHAPQVLPPWVDRLKGGGVDRLLANRVWPESGTWPVDRPQIERRAQDSQVRSSRSCVWSDRLKVTMPANGRPCPPVRKAGASPCSPLPSRTLH